MYGLKYISIGRLQYMVAAAIKLCPSTTS